jgi:hypothetical protein
MVRRDGPSRARCGARALDGGGEVPVAGEDHDGDERTQERESQSSHVGDANPMPQPFGDAGTQGTDGGNERADEAVAREQRRSLLVRDGRRQECLFGGEEHADVAAARVERADETDQGEWPERRERGESDTGGEHE